MDVGEYIALAALAFIAAFAASRVLGFVLRRIVLPVAGRYIVVNDSGSAGTGVTSSADDDEGDDLAVAANGATTTTSTATPIATGQNASNDLLLATKAETLAALVLAGKVTETDGIKIVYGVGPSSSNPRYLAARAALKAALERAQSGPQYQRTPEEAARVNSWRKEMGLTK